MRYQGKITAWKDEQGYGFIAPKGGGKQVFVHITAFRHHHRRPSESTLVTYEVKQEGNGRLKAECVQYVNESIRSHDGTLVLLFAIVFMICMALSALAGKLPALYAWLYFVASMVTFFIYQQDKSAATRHLKRIPEKTLHLMAFIGGWPGAIVAQKLLRHKCQKRSFQIVFWATVVLNGIVLGYALSMMA